ncbi:3'-5' exonuclease [Aliidiomarina maris]|uniref:Exonuclease n=1 Tax=Aliidiomarina maris TaxID=531312 RepID=A0A327WP21_9GAMM|nr:3'-5' exonuclease [Aliidiomarina maris]RAJ92938.1 inhibitor of KinA sporulation pathway (predicted exonuclease) [Aliidiomarina maris]RUO18332.1 exonuclease [Aliidiomarina maris]
MSNNALILVVDLEATCWDTTVPDTERRQTVHDMEIIEFGCVVAKLDGSIVDTNSFMVKPVMHPSLSAFCTALTSITQADVDAAPSFTQTVQSINQWLGAHPLTAWGSWGNYDKNQLQADASRNGTSPDFFELPHINLKTAWRKSNGLSRKAKSGLIHALAFHGLEFEGRHHRGVDDARNIARLMAWVNLPS